MRRYLVIFLAIAIILSMASCTSHKHSFGEWIIIKSASLEEEGLCERYCECGEKESNAIPMLRASEGLKLTLDSAGASYSVTGIGTCKDTSIVIPSTYNGMPVTKIADYAFSGCDFITSMVMPNSIISVGDSAFSICSSLTSVMLGDNLTNIGTCAFANCSVLVDIVIPSSVTNVGKWAFDNCSALTIRCKAESQPDTWNSKWNSDKLPVVWGYIEE